MAGGYESIATVKAVKLDYDVEKHWGSWNPTFDLFLTVSYNDGQDWDKDLEIFGNVKREIKHDDPKSWGSAFKVRTFFESAFNKKNLFLKEDYTIPDQWLDDVIDKQFMVCSYKTTKLKKNGKPFWNTYQIVAPSNSQQGYLKSKVLKDVQDGWIKNFATDDPATDFDYGANSKPKTSKPAEERPAADFDLDI